MAPHGSESARACVLACAFAAGCGNLNQGTPAQMHHALCEVLGGLPPETRVFCGHEYTGARHGGVHVVRPYRRSFTHGGARGTVKNLQFARTVEPDSEDVGARLKWAMVRAAPQSLRSHSRGDGRAARPGESAASPPCRPPLRTNSRRIPSCAWTARPCSGLRASRIRCVGCGPRAAGADMQGRRWRSCEWFGSERTILARGRCEEGGNAARCGRQSNRSADLIGRKSHADQSQSSALCCANAHSTCMPMCMPQR